VLQTFLHPIFRHTTISVVGVVLSIRELPTASLFFITLKQIQVQEILLSRFLLKEYVLEAPRTSLISANKEGIVSLLGMC
jgi:phosphatidylinositol glycan class W